MASVRILFSDMLHTLSAQIKTFINRYTYRILPKKYQAIGIPITFCKQYSVESGHK